MKISEFVKTHKFAIIFGTIGVICVIILALFMYWAVSPIEDTPDRIESKNRFGILITIILASVSGAVGAHFGNGKDE